MKQIRMEGFSQDSRYLYMLLEFVPGGELFTYLRTVGMLDATHAAYFNPNPDFTQAKSY